MPLASKSLNLCRMQLLSSPICTRTDEKKNDKKDYEFGREADINEASLII
jgi:hypothetical protein